MKKILIINGHPDKQSFCNELALRYKKSADTAGAECKLTTWRLMAKALTFWPYCTGAETPSGNSPLQCCPQWRHWKVGAWYCVVSTVGLGRSRTCRHSTETTVSLPSNRCPQAQRSGTSSMILSGESDAGSVVPACPGCPPGLRPLRTRELFVSLRLGLPRSVDGGK